MANTHSTSKHLTYGWVTVILIGLFLRIIKLFSRQDMWHDPSFTVLFSKMPFMYIIGGNDVHPPLFYLFMKPIVMLTTNEYIIRSINILWWLAFMVGLYLFMKSRGYDATIRLIVLGLMSVSPTMIFYSIEPRNYMMGMFFVICQVYFFFADRERLKSWQFSWKFILFSLLMIHTHYFTGFLLIAEFVYLLVKCFKELPRLFFESAIIFSFSIPLFIGFMLTLSRMESMWFKSINLWSFVSTISFQFIQPDSVNLFVFMFYISFVFVFIIFARKIRPDIFGAIFFFVPVILIFFLSQFSPMYHHRFFLFYAFGLYIFVAEFIYKLAENQKTRNIAYILCFWLCMVFAFGLVNYDNTLPTELYEAQLALKGIMGDREATIIHTSPFSQTPFKYYFAGEQNVQNLLYSKLTEKQRFTAGGAVIKESELVSIDWQCPDECYMVTEKSRYLHGQVYFDKGGLIVYKIMDLSGVDY